MARSQGALQADRDWCWMGCVSTFYQHDHLHLNLWKASEDTFRRFTLFALCLFRAPTVELFCQRVAEVRGQCRWRCSVDFESLFSPIDSSISRHRFRAGRLSGFICTSSRNDGVLPNRCFLIYINAAVFFTAGVGYRTRCRIVVVSSECALPRHRLYHSFYSTGLDVRIAYCLSRQYAAGKISLPL